MTADSNRSLRLVRRTVRSVSRRGLQFVRRASLGGALAASVFAATEATAQVVIPPDATGTASDTAGSSSFGAQSITFNAAGGTLTLNGTGTVVNNALGVRWYDDEFGAGFLNPIQNLINATSEGSTVLTTGPLNYRDDAAFGAVSSGLTSFDTFSGLWQGFMNVPTAGNVTLTTESDDGSVWWVDLNQNAVFEPNEFILTTQNLDQGATTRSSPATNLAVGTYQFAIGYYENGGGNVMRAAIQRPGDTGAINIDPSAAAQANYWSYSNNRTNNANFSTNAVTLNADGTIAVDRINAAGATIGTLTMAPGTKLTNTGARLIAGPLTTTGGTVTKAGTGVLALVPGTAVAAGTTVNVNQGILEITNNGPTTSLNNAPITLSGGTLLVNTVEDFTIPVAGLRQGRVAGAFNVVDTNPADRGIVLEPIRAQVVGNGNVEPWPDNTTYIYSGQMFFPDNTGTGTSTFAMAEHNDDSTQIKIDGQLRLSNGAWDVANTTGVLNLPAGWHDIELRFGEGGGGWGPSTSGGWVGVPAAGIAAGFGVDFITPIDTSNPPIQTEFQRPVDPGDATVFRVGANPVYGSNITVTENSSIQTTGVAKPQFGDLNINATKTLTVLGGNPQFQNVNLNAGTQTINVATGVTTNLGHFTDGANTGAILAKTGAGTLQLTDGTNDFSSSTVKVTAGTVQVTNTATGANPLGTGIVELNGGTLLLDTVPFAATGVTLGGSGSYTGNFYNLLAGSGSDAALGGFLDTQVAIETVTTGITAINFPSSNDNPFAAVMTMPAALTIDDHAARFTGTINVATGQNINFFTNSDDGSVLWIDLNNDGDFVDSGEEVVDNRGLHGMQVRNGSRFLAAGNYNVKVEMFERGGGSGLIAGWQGIPEFNNNINVTANSTLNVGGSAGATKVGNISISPGFTLTKTGGLLTAGDVTLNGNATINNTGSMVVNSITDGASTGTFTHTGPAANTATFTILNAGDLSGTTVNVPAGVIIATAANSLANSPGINLTGGGLRIQHADALSVATPVNVARSSFIDFDVPLTSSRKITVDPFGALVGKLANLSYGTGAGQVSLVNNSVLAPDPGETNLPAPMPPGNRLLLGITSNTASYTHGTETSTGPTDLYRGVAIGGWTDAGALQANLTGPTGGDLNISIVAPAGLLAGNNTFKTINPLTTQFNSSTGKVNMTGNGRVIINAGGPIGGSWTILNRTGDPTFRGANNVLLETAGGTPPGQIGGAQKLNLRHGSFNLPGGGAANVQAVLGTANILEGGTLVLDDTQPNSPGSGIFNVTGSIGTDIRGGFNEIIDINGDGIGDANDVSAGPGAIYTSINHTGNTNADGSPLDGGATYNVGVGFLMILDNDQSAFGTVFQSIINKADVIQDSNDANSYDDVSAIILGNGRRFTTTSNNSALVDNNANVATLRADPSLATTPGAKVIISAADGRENDINDESDFTGVDLQVGDPNPFTTTEGLFNNAGGRAFDQLRVARVTVPQTGRVRLAGVRADDVIVENGRLQFEDNRNPIITGNFIVKRGTMFTDNNANIMSALVAGNFGRAGAEIQLGNGGAFYPEIDAQAAAQTIATPVRTIEAGKSYIVLDEGANGNATTLADVTFNVTLAANSTIDLGLNGGNALLRANVTATAGGGAIENNASDTRIHAASVNAGGNPITFTGSRLTQLDAPITASAISVGDGSTRSGRLAVANLAHIGALPITISPSSQLAFNPGTGNTITPPVAQITQGSGALRAQSGTVDFGTGIVTGATVAPVTVAGLQHSVLTGSANLTEANANTDIQLGTLAATTPNLEGTFGANSAFGQVNSTHAYTGQFFDADGIVAFAEHFDDTVRLLVDGRQLLNNGAFDASTSSPDDVAGTPGLQTNIGMGPANDGWHTFDLRLGQGTGGVGAPGNAGNANWPFNTFGFGFNPDPQSTITNATLQSNYQPMLDNGSMNLFRSVIDPGAGDMIVDANATMKMGGFASQDSLALNGSATQAANLTLVNGSGTNTLLRTSVTGLGAVDNAAGSTVETGALTMANNATLTKLGGGTLNINGPQSNGTVTAITVSAGTANINTNAGSNTARNTTVNANSTTNFGSTQHLAALNVGAGATATVGSGGPKNLVTNALSIAGGSTPTGKLDVTDNAVIVDYPVAGPSPAPTIRDQIIVGRGGTGLGKPWNGLGISSTTAQADVANSPNSRSVGYAVNADLPLGALTTFRGQAVDPTSVLIRYTRTADANLDGVVNDDDVTVVGTFYAPGVPKPEWAKGDFDFNGFVDDDDVTLLGVFYNPAATPIPSPAGDAGGAGGVAAVPEPASWLMLTLGGLGAGLFGWRRRKSAK